MKEGWKLEKLGDVLKVIRGSSPRPIKNFISENEDGVNWIKIGDVGENEKYVTSTKQKITAEGALRSRYVEIGDFIFSNSMSFGRAYIMKIDGYIHDGWFSFKLPENIDHNYLWYLFRSPNLYEQIQKLASGAIVLNISGDLIKKAVLPLPLLTEQQAIVEKLDFAFDAIEKAKANIEKNIENAKELFQSKLNEIFSQKGEGWEEKKLKEVCSYSKIKNVKNLPYIGLEHIKANTGEFIGSQEPFKVKSDTFYFDDKVLLYGRLRPYLNKVFLPSFEGHCSTEIFPVLPNEKYVDRGFLFFWFFSENINKKINDTCTGARMPRANMNEVLNFTINYPSSLKVQKKIFLQLEELTQQISLLQEKYKQKLANLEELKKSILEKAFKGELV